MMDDTFILKDSGKREEFESGMVRDTQAGKGRFDLISPFAIMRLARIYEKGSLKYADRNWEKGASLGRFISSALRHIFQYMMGYKDEDHLAQAAWNLFAIMHLEQTHPELDNMPHYVKEDEHAD
jgi:hypothetical protein